MIRTGHQLRVARTVLNLSQDDLADRAFVHRNTLANYERLDLLPDNTITRALSRVLLKDERVRMQGDLLVVVV